MLGKNRVCWFVTSIQSPSCTRPAYDLNRDNRATSKRRHSEIASVGRNILEPLKQPRCGRSLVWVTGTNQWTAGSFEKKLFRRKRHWADIWSTPFDSMHPPLRTKTSTEFRILLGSVTKKGSWGFQRALRQCILLLIGWLQQESALLGASSVCFLALPTSSASICFQGVALEWCQRQFLTLLVFSTRMHLSLLAPNLSLWKLSLLNGLHLEGSIPDSYVLLHTESCLLVFEHFVASWQLAFVSQAGLCVAAPKC